MLIISCHIRAAAGFGRHGKAVHRERIRRVAKRKVPLLVQLPDSFKGLLHKGVKLCLDFVPRPFKSPPAARGVFLILQVGDNDTAGIR